jgi:uncharacterized protein (DUF2267 family)
MLVRGFYYEGWKPEAVPRKFHREQFLNDVQSSFQLSIDGGPARLVDGVMRVLTRHVEPGIIEKLKHDYPADLRSLFDRAA